MEIGLKILAAVLIGTAVYFYNIGQADYTFAAAAVGICAFFLSMRFAIKERLNAAAETEKENDIE